MRLPWARSRPSSSRLPLAPWALLALAAAGCADEPTVRLADYARYQRDHVTTRLVPAHSELATRLATDGWQVIPEEGGDSVLRMTRDRARLWFFSVDGSTTRVDLRGRVLEAGEDASRAVSYRVNDRQQTVVQWLEGESSLALPFNAGAARPGWNALDLYVKRSGTESGHASLELEGLRFQDRYEGLIKDESPREIAVIDGELLMPGESRLDLAFQVPDGAQLELRASSEAPDTADRALGIGIRLIDPTGAVHELGGFRLDRGDRDALDLDLGAWSGETVGLEVSVDGPRNWLARFDRAAVTGVGPRQTAEPPILPEEVESSGRLGRPDVVVIVLDAARADAFGVYGAEHPTPNVDSLAAAGTRFDRAQSPSSWTGQAIPALLSGFHPDTLHVERWGDPLPEQVPNIGELMAAAGYRTVLWSQHPIYNRAPTLVRGFEEIRYGGRRKRDQLPRRTLLFERGRPTFAFIHLLPPHSPYQPPEPFAGAYTSDYHGSLPPKLGALGRVGKKRTLELTAEDHAYIRGRYLENVAFADWLVGQIVGQMRRSKRFEDALVIVTSDHGEAFFEHGSFMHSRELYQEFVRIPMVVKWPRHLTEFAAAVGDPVTLIDLAPTLVDGLGLDVVRGGFQGRSLLPAALDAVALERPIYGTTRGIGDVTRTAKPRWMLEEGDWRVIHDPVAGSTELFAVGADPLDEHDLAPSNPTISRWMLQRVRAQRIFNLGLLGLGPRADIELDPELAEELRALGYL